MTPYRATRKPMKGEEQEALIDILDAALWYTPQMRLRVANLIIDAGFARRVPNKVTRLQLWSFFIETVLLVVCAVMVQGVPGLGFVYGATVSLALGGALTWVSGLIINAGIEKGTIK